MITSKTIAVTPKMAEEILTRHYERVANGKFKQRHVYRITINKYISDMKAGNWGESPVPIIFDEDENLLDGQHRLEAVRQSGVTIKFKMEYGWPTGVIDYIDRGKARSVGDQLHLHGQHNATLTASSVTSIIRVAYRGSSPAVSYMAAMTVLDKFGMRDHIESIASQMKSAKLGGRVVGPLAWYHSVSPKKAREFLRQIVDLDTEKGTGTQLFARYMRDRNAAKQSDAIRCLCSCIRLWDEDGRQEFVKFNIESIDWLANKNPKLKDNITGLFGLISQGTKRVALVKKMETKS